MWNAMKGVFDQYLCFSCIVELLGKYYLGQQSQDDFFKHMTM
jgi:hypothetical protein